MDGRDNNKLDDIIRQKMSMLAPSYKKSSWEQLAGRMDQLDAQEQFDEVIFDKLENIQPVYPNSWSSLAERLELEKQRIEAIASYKSLELALFLLMLFGSQFLYFAPNGGTNQQIQESDSPIASQYTHTAFDQNTTGEAIAQQGHNTPTNNEEATIALSINEINNNFIPKPTLNKSSIYQSKASNKIQKQKKQSFIPFLATSLPKEVFSEQSLRLPINYFTPEAQLLASSVELISLDVIANLEKSAISLLEYGQSDDLSKAIRPADKKTFLRIGFIGSPDYNRIITPTTVLESGYTIALDRYAIGYSGGLTVGLERGRFEMETGLVYSARDYQSIPALYISGSIKEGGYTGLSLREFELNTINVPLNFKYNFISHDKWRLYALGGASLNAVLQANYYTVDETAFGNDLSSDNARGGEEQSREAIKNKTLTKGWLEGGDFWKNATLFGDVGLGLERYFSPNFSLFTQPTYHHSFLLFNNGLGPYNDQIHTFSILMGLKVRI